jgi:hypothetical protein
MSSCFDSHVLQGKLGATLMVRAPVMLVVNIMEWTYGASLVMSRQKIRGLRWIRRRLLR